MTEFKLNSFQMTEDYWEIRYNKTGTTIGIGKTEREAWEDAEKFVNQKISNFNLLKHEIHDSLLYC